jgi:acetyl-CoA carboxylase biotin carboxyl carrier protein
VSLTAADVAEIMRLVEHSSFDELTLEVDGMKLCLRRGAAAQSVGSAAPPAVAVRSETTAPIAATPAPPSAVADPNIHEVTSPLLGTFYRAPQPGSPPFVEVGSRVEADTIVAIVEVMKLMNAVRAGVAGTVTEILANDGALVEYGERLLRVRKAGG